MSDRKQLPFKIKLLLALIAGAMLPFAFAPYEWRLLAFISPAVLFVLLHGENSKAGSWIAWVYGIGYFGLGVSWVYNSIHLFGAAIAPLAILITAGFVLVMTVFTALLGRAYCHLNKAQVPLYSALLFASVWTLLELLRGWVFGGFPWLLLGYSQLDTWLSGFAPVFGVYGLSWMVAAISAMLANFIIHAPSRDRIAASVISVLLLLGGYVLQQQQWAQDKADAVKIRMVQGNVKQELKFKRNRLVDTLQLYADLSLRSLPHDTDIVIWPETAIPTSFARVEPAMRKFVEQTEARGLEILSGGFYRDEENRPYNAFKQLGNEQQMYKKHHLVPFGEFFPLRSYITFITKYMDVPMSDLSAGELKQQPMLIKGERLGISICFEDVFGEEMRFSLP